jgi:hypothetical protein
MADQSAETAPGLRSLDATRSANIRFRAVNRARRSEALRPCCAPPLDTVGSLWDPPLGAVGSFAGASTLRVSGFDEPNSAAKLAVAPLLLWNGESAGATALGEEKAAKGSALIESWAGASEAAPKLNALLGSCCPKATPANAAPEIAAPSLGGAGPRRLTRSRFLCLSSSSDARNSRVSGSPSPSSSEPSLESSCSAIRLGARRISPRHGLEKCALKLTQRICSFESELAGSDPFKRRGEAHSDAMELSPGGRPPQSPGGLDAGGIRAVTSHLVCPICSEFLQAPMLMSCCGTLFCSGCIRAVCSHRTTCPSCRREIPALERVLVRCPALTAVCTELERSASGLPRQPDAPAAELLSVEESEKRKMRVPSLSSLKLADLKRLLQGVGLPTSGERHALERRYRAYCDQFNALLDGGKVPNGPLIVRKVTSEERKTRSRGALGGSLVTHLVQQEPREAIAPERASLPAPEVSETHQVGGVTVHVHIPGELAALLKGVSSAEEVVVARAKAQSIALAASVAERDWARRRVHLLAQTARQAPSEDESTRAPKRGREESSEVDHSSPKRRLRSVLSPECEAQGWRSVWSEKQGRPFFIHVPSQTGQWDSPEERPIQHAARAPTGRTNSSAPTTASSSVEKPSTIVPVTASNSVEKPSTIVPVTASSSVESGQLAGTPETGTWACKTCTYLHDSPSDVDRTHCAMCGGARHHMRRSTRRRKGVV